MEQAVGKWEVLDAVQSLLLVPGVVLLASVTTTGCRARGRLRKIKRATPNRGAARSSALLRAV